MKSFDYEKFIDECEYGYELQQTAKYIGIIKYNKKKTGIFGKDISEKWYSPQAFIDYIFIKMNIKNIYGLYNPTNWNINDHSEKNDCDKFVKRCLFYYKVGEPPIIIYFTVEEFKCKVKDIIKSNVTRIQEMRDECRREEEARKEALEKFNEKPYHFIRCK